MQSLTLNSLRSGSYQGFDHGPLSAGNDVENGNLDLGTIRCIRVARYAIEFS